MKHLHFFATVYFLCLFTSSFQLFSQHILKDTPDEKLHQIKSKYLLESKSTHNWVLNSKEVLHKKQTAEVFNDMEKSFLESLSEKRVFFHSEVSPLLESIFKRIVESNPDYDLADIQLLLGLNGEKNAYSKGNKIIVINFPIVLSMESEAQLAFIICHEIAHEELKHVPKSIVKSVNYDNSPEVIERTKQIKNQKYNKRQVARSELKNFIYGKRRFSRTYEFEADSLGYVLFRNAYPDQKNSAITALNLIRFIDKDKDSLSVSDYYRIFEHQGMDLKDAWFSNDEISRYNYQKSPKFWDVDSLRTHPETEKRIENLIKNFNLPNDFDEPSDLQFEVLKQKIKYDEMAVFYELKKYGLSLYYTLMAAKNDLNNPRLNQLIYLNFNQLLELQRQYKLNKSLDTVSPEHSDSYNLFLSFIWSLRISELESITQTYEKFK